METTSADLLCILSVKPSVLKVYLFNISDISESPQAFGYNRGGVPASPAMMGGRQQQQMQQMRGQATKRSYSSREGKTFLICLNPISFFFQ